MIWGSSLYEVVILANSILVKIYPNIPCIHGGSAVDNDIVEEAEGGSRQYNIPSQSKRWIHRACCA